MAQHRHRGLVLFGLLAVSTCVPAPTPQAILPHPPYRQDVVPEWLALDWPKNAGCVAAPASETLPAGTLIDRFGNEYGSYFSPRGESFAARSLPYVCSQTAYTVYRVTTPLHVLTCKTMPWFGEPGGATQYKTDAPAMTLRQEGAIEPVPDAGSKPCEAASVR